MKITERDVELMGWILEQKFMTERQVRQVFWKGLSEESHEVFRRLRELGKAGFLTTNKKLSPKTLYLVTRNGASKLKALNRSHGLGELSDEGNSNYIHDLAVTDIRILFHEWGYTEWLSERVLSKRNDLRQVPDGIIFNNDKYIAIEYESCQKSKRRYRKILLGYELDRHVDKVLYITATPELAQKASKEVTAWHKPHFVWLGSIQRDCINAKLKSIDGECSLNEFLGGR